MSYSQVGAGCAYICDNYMRRISRNKKSSPVCKKIDLKFQSRQSPTKVVREEGVFSQKFFLTEKVGSKHGSRLEKLSGKRYEHCFRDPKMSNHQMDLLEAKGSYSTINQKLGRQANLTKASKTSHFSHIYMKFDDTQCSANRKHNVDLGQKQRGDDEGTGSTETTAKIRDSTSSPRAVRPNHGNISSNKETQRLLLSQQQATIQIPECPRTRRVRPKSSFGAYPCSLFSQKFTTVQGRETQLLTSRSTSRSTSRRKPQSSLEKLGLNSQIIDPYTNQHYLHLKTRHKEKIKKVVEEVKKNQVMLDILKPCQIYQKRINPRQSRTCSSRTEQPNQHEWFGHSKKASEAQRNQKDQLQVEPWETQIANYVSPFSVFHID